MSRPVILDTTMKDLNDDCLHEVFAHLDRKELCEVADTCKRFRSIAQKTFGKSTFKTVDVVGCSEDGIKRNDLRLLRNFGENIESISVSFDGYDPDIPHIPNFNEFFVYVGRFCGSKLNSMYLGNFNITAETANNLRPAICNLQKLQLSSIINGSALVNNLHTWSPNLRDLIYSQGILTSRIPNGQHPHLRHTFPRLRNVHFWDVHLLEDFIRMNPQLQKMKCDTELESIFSLVATHVPAIEHLKIYAPHAIFPENMDHLNKLRSLKSIHLRSNGRENPPIFESAIHSMEKVELVGFDFLQMGTELTRLGNLKILRLWHIVNMTPNHIFDILLECRQLRLLVLESCVNLNLTEPDVLDILQFGEALQRFEAIGTGTVDRDIIFDADSYLEMVDIVNSRSVGGMKMKLYPMESVIPIEMLVEHRNVLEFI